MQDDTPALYEYIQRFEHPLDPQQIVERRTLFVALKLEPYENGVVLPHEETHPKAKADRLQLMRATHANPGTDLWPVRRPAARRRHPPAAGARQVRTAAQSVFPGKTGPDTEQHLIYRHTDPQFCRPGAFFAPQRVWIADGHHRYETALNYQKEQAETGTATGRRTCALRLHSHRPERV